jgi:ABC-2 type transport system ATP-binding protein
MHGMRNKLCSARIEEVANTVGITNLFAQRAGSLSRGQRQRVGIAQALIHKPKIVILDEPAAGLDPEARHELSTLVLALRDSGCTLLISSHILAELEDYSDAMLTLNNGKILGHVPVGKGVTVGARRQIRLQVVGDQTNALTFLAAQPNVTNTTVTPNGLIATLSDGGDEAQATLIKLLITNNIPVLSFSEYRTGMQDVYLSQVSARGALKP